VEGAVAIVPETSVEVFCNVDAVGVLLTTGVGCVVPATSVEVFCNVVGLRYTVEGAVCIALSVLVEVLDNAAESGKS
jgi:hypothetical protein